MAGFEKGFTTLKKETSIDNVPVVGNIPEWLDGFLIRNGPAMFETTHDQFQHWFDGLAMLHKFSIKNGRVAYRNKFINSRGYQAAQEFGKIIYNEFATAPKLSFWEHLKSIYTRPQFSQNPNVNIAVIDNKLYALTETPEYVKINHESLETEEVVYRDLHLNADLSLAHPLTDSKSGDIYNLAVQFGFQSNYIIYKIPNGKEPAEVVAKIPVKKPTYMHSFGMTDNYIILVEYPLRINLLSFLLAGQPFITNYNWNSSEFSHFVVINKKTGEIEKTLTSTPFLYFHIVNAFEDKSGKLVIDIPVYADTTIIRTLYLRNLAALEGDIIPHNEVRRYVLDLEKNDITFNIVSKNYLEFPCVNIQEPMNGDYTYCYGASYRPEKNSDFYNCLLKLNIKTQEQVYLYENNNYYGEPIFIASPGAQTEDDGVVLSVVLDGEKEESFLLVIDAKSFTEIARAELKHHIPFGLHGRWFKSGELKAQP